MSASAENCTDRSRSAKFFQARNNQFYPFESLKMEIPLLPSTPHMWKQNSRWKFSVSLWDVDIISYSCLKRVHTICAGKCYANACPVAFSI